MISVDLNVGEVPDIENAEGLMLDAIATMLRDFADQIVALSSQYVPVDTGDLLSSITRSRVERGPDRVKVVVGSNEPYSAYVEFGTGRRGAASYHEFAAKYNWPWIEYRLDWAGMPAGGGVNKRTPYLTRAIDEVTGNGALQADLETAIQMAWEGLM